MAKTFKPKRGLGAAVTRQRRKLADNVRAQADARIENEKKAAREEMDRWKKAQKAQPAAQTSRWNEALLGAVARDQTAFMRSIKLAQPVYAAVDARLNNVLAYTDFKSVTVKWPQSKMPEVGTAGKDLRYTIAQMKGVLQHEIGHIRFTTPWVKVLDVADTSANDDRQDASLNLGYHHDSHELQMVWNGIEDGRMENLVVDKVPRIANYFAPMVKEVIIKSAQTPADMMKSWLLISGRTYLPIEVRQVSYDLFDTLGDLSGMPNAADQWAAITNKYMAAATEQQMFDIVLEAADFIHKLQESMPQGLDSHDEMNGGEGEGSPGMTSRKRPSDRDKLAKGKGGKGDGSSKEKGEKGKGSGKGKDGDEDGDGKASGHRDNFADRHLADHSAEVEAPEADGSEWSDGQSNAGNGGEVFTPQDLLDALEETSITAQEATANEVRSLAASAFEIFDKEGLKEYTGSGQVMEGSMLMESEAIAVGIQNSLNSFVTASAPIWHNRVNTGVIDALAYRTKEIGTQDFHRHLEDHGANQLDVHVSVLADVSYSMQPYMGQLSKFMYAAGRACQDLGIGATFTLWSSGSENYRIWGGGVTPEVFPAMGGTDPLEALDDLETHNQEEAAHHLVLVFTDGAWSNGFPSLQRWGRDDRTIVFIRYGAGSASGLEMGADRAIAINNLAELPEHLTNALIDVLSIGAR